MAQVVLARSAIAALKGLDYLVAEAVLDALGELERDPMVGHALRGRLAGLRSYRVGADRRGVRGAFVDPGPAADTPDVGSRAPEMGGDRPWVRGRERPQWRRRCQDHLTATRPRWRATGPQPE